MVGFQSPGFQPVAGLARRLIAGTITNNSGFDPSFFLHDWLGDKFPGSLKLLFQSIENVFIVVFNLGVPGVGIVARYAGKVGGHAVRISGDRSVRYAVAVLIKVTAELLAGLGPFLKLLCA